jgi:hypothetical protein
LGTEEFGYNGQRAFCHNFLGSIASDQLSKIKLQELSLADFVFVSFADLSEIKPIGPDINPEEQIALFKDQYMVLKKILDK